MQPVVASLEIHDAPAVGTLRVHAPGAVFGGPYEWACTVLIAGDTAMLHGALVAPTPTQWRAIVEVLQHHGAARMTWERRVAGRPVRWRTVEFSGVEGADGQ